MTKFLLWGCTVIAIASTARAQSYDEPTQAEQLHVYQERQDASEGYSRYDAVQRANIDTPERRFIDENATVKPSPRPWNSGD